MEQGKIGEIYHLSPDRGVAVKDVVQLICKKLGEPFERATKVVEERLGQDAAYVIDSTKARNEFKWMSEISLEEGIERTIQWINKNWEAIQQEPLEYVHKQ